MSMLRTAVLSMGMTWLSGNALAEQPGAAKDAAKPVDKVPLSIEAQPMTTALNQWAQQTGMMVMVSTEGEAGTRISPPVKGEYTPEKALKLLLASSNLRYEFVGERTVAVRVATAGRAEESKKSSDEKESARPSGLDRGQSESTQTEEAGHPRADSDADSAHAGSSVSSLEEIVVTAQKRAERLQDVPISISVVSGDQLDRSTLPNLTETLNRIPGVVATVPSVGNPRITVRGVPAQGAGGTVAYYVDSVPFGFARQTFYPDTSIYDLERIEVLRGPQGTLYGASAVAGVLRILTKAPDLDSFELKVRSSAATVKDGSGDYRADAALNIPLVEDRLAVRVAGGYQDIGGWIDKPTDKDANSGNVKTLRVKTRAQPTEALTLDVGAWLSRSDFGAQTIGQADRTTPVTAAEPISYDFDTYSFSAGYDFGGVTLNSATSYIDYQLINNLSFQPINLTTLQRSNFGAEVFAEELVLQSTGQESLHWTIGAMYRDAKDRFTQAFNGAASNDYSDRSQSYAIFGEVTQPFLDGRWEATLGLRYFHDKFSTRENLSPPGTSLLAVEDTSTAVTPRFVLAWHPQALSTVYASYAQGFRSGLGQNPTTLRNPLFAGSGLGSAKSDKLHNYEIGAKAVLFDGRLDFDTAAYYMDWKDVKAVVSVPVVGNAGPFINALVNGPSASGVGIDAMVTFRPTNGLEIGGSVSWNDLTMDDDVISGVLVVYNKGDRLAFSPETTANGFVEYSFPLASLTGRINASVNYISSQTQVSAGPTVFEGDSITTESASFTIDSGDRWSVSLFGDNLSDENGIPSNNANIGPWQPRILPRTIGIQLEFHY